MSNAANTSFFRLTALEDSAAKLFFVLFFESFLPIKAHLADFSVTEIMINDYRNVCDERRRLLMTRLNLELGVAKLSGGDSLARIIRGEVCTRRYGTGD